MRPLKNPKKSSDEDRSRKKKIKSKSAKRRRDPSPSHSSSSEFELDSRSRRKSSKSKKLEKRRKESKKTERRKSRKKRHRRDSSVSSFSSDSGRRSCSTCSDSERSRSPVSKSKSRKRERERVRKNSRRRLESSRSSRYRSRSCSPCSKSWGHSRTRSPIEGRYGSSRGRSSRYRSPSCYTCSGSRSRSRSRSRNPIEERYGSSHARSPHVEESPPIEERFGSSPGRSRYMEEGETKRLRSVLALTRTSDEDEDKIIEAYDDHPRSNEGYDDEGNKKRNLDVGNRERDSYGTRIREDVTSSKDRGQPIKDSDLGDSATNDYSMRKESEVVGEDGGKEADDLEMILRQKALENFRKFRGVRPANRESLSDKKDESSKLESCQGSQSFMKTPESNPPCSLDDHRHVQGGIHPNKLKARSVANISTQKIDGNTVRNLSNDAGGFKPVVISIANQNTLNQFKRLQELSDKISSEESSLTKDSQNKKFVALPDSGKVGRAEIDTADKPASDALNAENQNCKANEPMVESSSGSQFEKKTFSRVRDGETVQASYKVYIPKKTPALARRQLQR